MVNRIWIEPSVFRVSRPGVDVFAAGDSSLLFNSDWGGGAKFIKGSIAGSRGGSGTSSHTALFGKTFSVKPCVMSVLTAGSGASRPGESYPVKGFGDSTTPFSDFAFSWSWFEVQVLSDRVNFSVKSAGSSFSYTISYLVFDYRIGF